MRRFTVTALKGLVWLYNAVKCLRHADRMVNSVDPDQTAPWGAVWSGSTVLLRLICSNIYKFTIGLDTLFDVLSYDAIFNAWACIVFSDLPVSTFINFTVCVATPLYLVSYLLRHSEGQVLPSSFRRRLRHLRHQWDELWRRLVQTCRHLQYPLHL